MVNSIPSRGPGVRAIAATYLTIAASLFGTYQGAAQSPIVSSPNIIDPSFTNEGNALIYVDQRPNGNEDIKLYDLENQQTTNLTRSSTKPKRCPNLSHNTLIYASEGNIYSEPMTHSLKKQANQFTPARLNSEPIIDSTLRLRDSKILAVGEENPTMNTGLLFLIDTVSAVSTVVSDDADKGYGGFFVGSGIFGYLGGGKGGEGIHQRTFEGDYLHTALSAGSLGHSPMTGIHFDSRGNLYTVGQSDDGFGNEYSVLSITQAGKAIDWRKILRQSVGENHYATTRPLRIVPNNGDGPLLEETDRLGNQTYSTVDSKVNRRQLPTLENITISGDQLFYTQRIGELEFGFLENINNLPIISETYGIGVKRYEDGKITLQGLVPRFDETPQIETSNRPELYQITQRAHLAGPIQSSFVVAPKGQDTFFEIDIGTSSGENSAFFEWRGIPRN